MSCKRCSGANLQILFFAVSLGSGAELERADEERILQELVEVVEQRDALVSLLEEDRQRYHPNSPL